MYMNILKKDLSRKKTMNIILMLFITLAVMFVSSSINNLISVTTALDTYFDMSGIADFTVATRGTVPNEKSAEDIAKSLDYVDSYKTEHFIYVPEANTKYDGKNLKLQNPGVMSYLEGSKLKYFKSNNDEITTIGDDEIYLRKSVLTDNNIKVGDKIEITINNKSKVLTVKGSVKDALLGSSMMGTPRWLISKSTYDFFRSADGIDNYLGSFLFVETDNISDFKQEMNNCSNIIFMGDKALIKTTYILDMVIASVLLIISICLILISFVILKFTITFTIKEEYKEIGIMKAIGITNIRIRSLYMIKYLAISIIGACIGFVFSLPFGNLLLQQVSENIVILSNNNFFVSIACSLLIVAIIMFFCYSCTGKVKKSTPVDAIRNGETGERYKKKGILKLSKSRLKPVMFMAVNDILSQLGHFIIMFVTFVIGVLLITIIVNTMNTLKSDSLVSWFSMAQSDLYLREEMDSFINENGQQQLSDKLNEIENRLKENGIEADCFAETCFKFTVSNGDKTYKSLSFKGTNTTTEQYEYIDGTAPQNTNEIAMTYIIADTIDAKIGDTVKVTTTQGEKEYIITAIFQSMNNMGEGIRFHQDENFNFSQALGFFAYQIKYTDNPSQSIINDRVEKIKDIFPKFEVYKGGEYVDYMIGGISDYMSGIKILVVFIVMIINILVVVLMEKSFLIKEKSEIAILKAIGFNNNLIIFWQSLRVGIIMFLSSLVAILLSNPVGQISSGLVFQIMGAKNIIFDVNIFESYIIYPLTIIFVTVLAVVIVSQEVRRISSSEINNIE